MGWTYEVTMWVQTNDGWQDEFAYRGESLLSAVLAIRRARKISSCVRLTWRG
jgi:hypothetical protein